MLMTLETPLFAHLVLGLHCRNGFGYSATIILVADMFMGLHPNASNLLASMNPTPGNGARSRTGGCQFAV